MSDLRELRRRGLSRARDARLPALARACRESGTETPQGGVLDSARLENLLRSAIELMDDDLLEKAANVTFGLAPGTRMWSAAQRRTRAAREFSVTEDRFRKRYEIDIVNEVATAIGALLTHRPSTPGRYDVDQAPDQASSHVHHLASTSLRRLGRRRTAYPLDLSLSELAARDLIIRPRLTDTSDSTRKAGPAELVELLAGRQSVLVLGEPGSGKTVGLYATALEARDAGLRLVVVRAVDAEEVLGDPDWVDAGRGDAGKLVLFIDGIDEAIHTWEARGGVPQRVLDAVGAHPCLMTARTREFESTAALHVLDTFVDRLFTVAQWRPDVELRTFLDRLAVAGILEDDPADFYDLVLGSAELTRLATRPLYARMLTFLGRGAATTTADTSMLYSEYLTKLARVADLSLQNRGCHVDSLRTWKHVAWAVHREQRVAGEVVAIDGIEQRIAGDDDAACTRSALDHILDRRIANGRELGEFIHYSFYETLIAQYICDQLIVTNNLAELTELFVLDLPREVRHRLVDQLLDLRSQRITQKLLDCYSALRSSIGPAVERLTACNLIIYLLSRSSEGGGKTLEQIQATETDDFLLISTLWALCHLGSYRALADMAERLEYSEEWRSMCRGYVLYYYGDLPRHAGPPYYDPASPDHVPTTRTREKVPTVLAEMAHSPSPDAHPRTWINLYTFADIIRVRDSVMTSDEHHLATGLLDRLRRADERITATQLALLETSVSACTERTDRR